MRQFLRSGDINLQCLEVTVVNADERAFEFYGAFQFFRVMNLDQYIHTPFMGDTLKFRRFAILKRGHNQQDTIRTESTGLNNLIGVEHEILTQDRQ